jgi:hypothetical protein
MNVLDIQSDQTMRTNNNTVFIYNNTRGNSLSGYQHIKHALQRRLKRQPQVRACRNALRQQRLRQIKRKGRFRRLIRRVVGGLPFKAYALTLKIQYAFDYERFADHTQHFTFQYKSKVESVKEDTVDDAIQQFLKNYNKSVTFSYSFESGDAIYIDHEVMSNKLLPDAKLSALPLYGFHTLADKCCPDDDMIQTTPGQCVINGLYCMLKATKHYKGITEQKLINAIGTKTPSIDDLERWLTNEKYHYCDYVSLNIIDPLNKKLFRHVARKNGVVTVTAKVNNQHFYLITQTDLRQQLKDKECLDLNLLRIRAELTEHNFEYCDDLSRPVQSIQPYVLCEAGDLSNQLKGIQSQTRTLVNEVSFHGTKVVAFEHPITNQMYLAAPNYKERKATAAKLFQDTSFVFLNQTYSQLGKAYMMNAVGEIPEGTYNQHHLDILDNFPISPYVCRLEDQEEGPDDMISIDIKNAYPSVLTDMRHKWGIVSIRDKIELYHVEHTLSVGWYFVTKHIRMAGGNMLLPPWWYPHNFTDRCLRRGYIKHNDIQFMMKSTFALPANTFGHAVMPVLDKLEKEGTGKHVLNHFIGQLGQKHYKQTHGAMTTSFDTAVGTCLQYTDGSVRYHEVGDTYFIRRETQQRKYSGHAFLHAQILAETYCKMDDMYRQVTNNGLIEHKIFGWNTDAMKIVIDNPMDITPKNKCLPGDYHQESEARLRGKHISEVLMRTESKTQLPPKQWRIIESDISIQESCLIEGMPGTGKTRQLVTEEIQWAVDNDKTFAVLGYTCNSCHNITSQKECKECAHVMTLDKFFEQHKSVEAWIQKAKDLAIIFIEEFSMIPKKFIFVLFQIKHRYPHIMFRIFGDHNQCPPMDKDWIEYIECPAFQFLVDYNICTLEYKEGTSRYIRSLLDILIHLLNTGKLHPSLYHKRLNDNVHMSMCLTGITIGSATRKRINAKQRQKWQANNGTTIGMPIVSTNNNTSLKIMNGQRFTIHAINEDHIVLLDKDVKFQVPLSDFNKRGNFEDGFCDSVFRYQGRTIREPYNIYDIKRMSRQDLYVALSRFTTDEHIFFDARGLKNHVFNRKKPPPLGQRISANVQPYRIYRITSVDKTDDSEYIGYTKKTLHKRLQEHIEKPTNVEMRKWMPESQKTIELIEAITYLTLQQVKDLESKYIAAIPRHRCKNSQHKQKQSTRVVDLTKRCKFVTPGSVPIKQSKPPTVKFDTKRREYKAQKRHNGKNITTYGDSAEEAEDKWRAKVAQREQDILTQTATDNLNKRMLGSQ